ncbi:helix-turn-helix domain-containing protein [Pediococcus siamensis]|uniref:helix-turn-helix domain-containing protein n=1 Tax=Pediococcus siamensis TaxID=381829 RepID=UPI00399FA0D0
MIESIGKIIHQHRVAQHLTIATLAEAAGVSDSYISRLELGTVKDSHVSKLNNVAKALGLKLSDLFTDTDLDPYTVELISKLTSLPNDQRKITSKHILELINILSKNEEDPV